MWPINPPFYNNWREKKNRKNLSWHKLLTQMRLSQSTKMTSDSWKNDETRYLKTAELHWQRADDTWGVNASIVVTGVNTHRFNMTTV